MTNISKKDTINITNEEWKCWCRLCARENAQNINVLIQTNSATTAPIATTGNIWNNSSETLLVDFIEDFFRINMKNDTELSQFLCTQCFSLVWSLIEFVEHVKQVQTMYNAIRLTGELKPSDLRLLRQKYNSLEDDIYSCKMLNQENSPEKTAKSTIEKIFVADNSTLAAVPPTNTAEQIDVKSELLADEDEVTAVQGALFDITTTAEHKSEGADPIGDASDNSNISDNISDKSDKSSNKDNREFNVKFNVPKNKLKETTKKKNKRKTYRLHKCIEKESAEEPKYHCTSCSLHFQRIGNYRVHMKKMHESTKEPLTCPECAKTFKTKFKLSRHIQTHRPAVEKKIFPCPQCDRKFQTKDYVTKHIQFVHEDLRPFICEECGEAVRTETTLREHMLIHTDYAPFVCDVCKKGFKNQYRLKNHKEMHSAHKHICSECGLQLNSRVTFNRHMLVHSDDMPHKCDYCGRAFKRAKTLKNHLILHSGLKPYSCDFCERTFATGANCRTHKRKTHPEELAALEAAGMKAYTKNIPKLSVLKTVTRSAENLKPVVSKSSGNFSLGKRPKPALPTSDCADKNTAKVPKVQNNVDGDVASAKASESSEAIQQQNQHQDQISCKEKNSAVENLKTTEQMNPPFWNLS